MTGVNTQVPQHWPKSLNYINRPEYSSAIDRSVIKVLSPRGICSRTTISYTRIRKIEDVNHPAYGQFGLFASKDLKPGEHIVDYIGYYHLPTPDDSDATSDYDLSLRHGALYLGIDAAKIGNEARMLNDYRGVEESANARFDSYVNIHGEIRMGVFAIGSEMKGGRGIKKGEEILVSYGKGFWNNR